MAPPDHTHDEAVDDDAHLDGCDIDFTEHEVDDETAAISAMFADVPEDEIPALIEFYREGADADA